MKVLIVDDNSANLYLLKSIMSGQGWEVLEAENGKTALETARLQRPSLIVSDILMPVMDGYEFCRICKQDSSLQDIPFVFYTATYTEPENERFALSLGADLFLLKPQEPDILISAILELLKNKAEITSEASTPLSEEMEYLRLHNEALFKKLEKKMTHLENADQKLKRLENLYRLSFDQVSDVIFIIDTNLTISSISPGVEKILGYPPAEFIDRPMSDFRHMFTPESFKRAAANMDLILKGKTISGSVYEFITRDKALKYLEISGAPILKDGEVVAMVSVARDFTERKLAEEAVKLNEARLESLLKIAQYQACSVTDLLDFALEEAIVLTGSKIGYIYFYDEEKKQFQLNAWSKEVMKECRISKPQTVYDLEKTGIWGEAVRQSRPIMLNNFQAPHPLKKGYPEGHAHLYRYMTIPLFSKEKIVAVAAVANKEEDYTEADVRQLTLLMDAVWRIAEQRKSEEKRIRAEEMYRSIFENAQEGIFQTTLDGRYLSVNPSFARMFGYDSPADMMESVTDIGSQLYVDPGERQRLKELLMQQESVQDFVVSLYRKDGRKFWVAINVHLVRNQEGDILYLEGTNEDITVRWEAEEKIRKLNEELEQRIRQRTADLEAANRELESFSYSVSHDLRAPLRSIDGFSEMLLEDYADVLDEQGRDYLERVRAGAKRMNLLIENLLNLSRVTRLEFQAEKVDLSAVVKAVAETCREGNPQQTVDLMIQEGIWALGDANLLKIAMTNLLENAWKFTGKIDQPRIEFGSTDLNDHPVFYIRDNGAGFDMKYAAKMFNAFQRFHHTNEFPGTGIGLATVKRIIERHGGRIWAESEPQQGATFFFTLPTDDRHG
jgi:PAS domain S-box-containing protein